MLYSRFDKIARTLDEEMDPAVRATSEYVSEAAKVKVSVRTGRLRSAIHVEKNKDCHYQVVAGNETAYWGGYLERGTEHMDSEPFLEPATRAWERVMYTAAVVALKDL